MATPRIAPVRTFIIMISFAPRYTILATLAGFLVSLAAWSQRDVPFAERDKEVLRMDLYLAESPEAPWLVFAHGGGFSGGSRAAGPVVDLAEGLAARGVNVASISYRLRQVGVGFGCNVPVEDKREAMRWAAEDLGAAVEAIRARGAHFIAVGGSSAGAEAALLYGLVLADRPVDAIVSFSGALEAEGLELDDAPPLFAFHGTCDGVVPFGRAVHRGCSADSPGAFVLDGGGALHRCYGAAMRQAVLWAFDGAGHEVCNNAMQNSTMLDGLAQRLNDLHRVGAVLPDEFWITLSDLPCASSYSLPCP